MLFYVDKFNLHKAPQVYWAHANEKNPQNPVELYYNMLMGWIYSSLADDLEKNINESHLAVAVRGHAQGFISMKGNLSRLARFPWNLVH
jgi:hypothetical protein